MRILIACLLLLPFSVFAGSVGTTKTFASGDTLTATDLNGNVTALTAAIDDNDSRITGIRPALGYYANGLFIGWAGPNGGLISDKGYFFSVSETGDLFGLGPTFYESANCTGPQYKSKFMDRRTSNGEVISVVDIGIIYIPADAVAVSTTFNSSGSFANCNVSTFVGVGYYLTQPNDPSVTGVQNSYTPPFHWGIQ